MPLVQPPPGQRPPDIPLPVYWLAGLILWIFGWKYGGGLPNYPKMVFCAAPHTTNWDGFWYLVMTARMRVRTHVIVKAELLRVPVVGWIFKLFGAIGIDRRSSQNMVEQMVEEYNKRDKLALVIAPEGTRHRTEYWRAGFYWIAHRAKVPIAIIYLNYRTKSLAFAGVLEPSGDIHADMAILAELYGKLAEGRHPEKAGPVRVRSDHAPSEAEAGAPRAE